MYEQESEFEQTIAFLELGTQEIEDKEVAIYTSHFIYSIFVVCNKLLVRIYRVYQKKGNRTLQCSSAFIIQSTEIILSQAERPGF